MPAPYSVTQVNALALQFGMTVAEVHSAYDTVADPPEVKKWKDRFTAAAALWINCEMQRLTDGGAGGGGEQPEEPSDVTSQRIN